MFESVYKLLLDKPYKSCSCLEFSFELFYEIICKIPVMLLDYVKMRVCQFDRFLAGQRAWKVIQQGYVLGFSQDIVLEWKDSSF